MTNTNNYRCIAQFPMTDLQYSVRRHLEKQISSVIRELIYFDLKWRIERYRENSWRYCLCRGSLDYLKLDRYASDCFDYYPRIERSPHYKPRAIGKSVSWASGALNIETIEHRLWKRGPLLSSDHSKDCLIESPIPFPNTGERSNG